MDNQRIVLGPALGGKDTGRRRTVQSIRRQAINGLGGDSHQLAFPQQPGRLGNPLGIAAQQQRLFSFLHIGP